MTPLAAITGIGSVSPYGPLTGLIPQRPIEPETITAWPTAGLRRAFLVKPFRPSDVVPGLKTRQARGSVVGLGHGGLFPGHSGCRDRSEQGGPGAGCGGVWHWIRLRGTHGKLYQSAAVNGWSGTDPARFPKVWPTLPASHVAILHGLRGPNITVGSTGFAGKGADPGGFPAPPWAGGLGNSACG